MRSPVCLVYTHSVNVPSEEKTPANWTSRSPEQNVGQCLELGGRLRSFIPFQLKTGFHGPLGDQRQITMDFALSNASLEKKAGPR